MFAPLRVPFFAIFAGCVVPDLPWIIQRSIDPLNFSFDPIATYAYFVAQASLAGCLFACVAFASLFQNVRTTALFAFAGCAAHLFLDSLQNKWGNGVHLLAPFNWDYLNIGIIEINSTPILALTFFGLFPFLFVNKARIDASLLFLRPGRLGGCSLCTVLYVLLPLAFVDDVVASNSRDLATLSQETKTIGATLELDRESVTNVGGDWYTSTHIGENLKIANPFPEVADGETYSIRATFSGQNEIVLNAWKKHSDFRDIASYLGLTGVAFWFFLVLGIRLRQERKSN